VYKIRAVVLGTSGRAEVILGRWELNSSTLHQAKTEFDLGRWQVQEAEPTAYELLERDEVVLRRQVHGARNYGPWSTVQ
jgi:hypothetical protein